MVLGIIKKNLKKGFVNLSGKLDAKPNEVSIFVHTKDGEYTPEYFEGGNKTIRRDENGNIIPISFKEFLSGKGFSPIDYEAIASQFFSTKLKALEQELEIDASKIYINIYPKDESCKDFEALIIKDKKAVQKIPLEAVFGQV